MTALLLNYLWDTILAQSYFEIVFVFFTLILVKLLCFDNLYYFVLWFYNIYSFYFHFSYFSK